MSELSILLGPNNFVAKYYYCSQNCIKKEINKFRKQFK